MASKEPRQHKFLRLVLQIENVGVGCQGASLVEGCGSHSGRVRTMTHFVVGECVFHANAGPSSETHCRFRSGSEQKDLVTTKGRDPPEVHQESLVSAPKS